MMGEHLFRCVAVGNQAGIGENDDQQFYQSRRQSGSGTTGPIQLEI